MDWSKMSEWDLRDVKKNVRLAIVETTNSKGDITNLLKILADIEQQEAKNLAIAEYKFGKQN